MSLGVVIVLIPESWQLLLQQGPESSRQTIWRNTGEWALYFNVNKIKASPSLSYTGSLWRLRSNRRNWSGLNRRPRWEWGWRCCCKCELCGPSRARERKILFPILDSLHILSTCSSRSTKDDLSTRIHIPRPRPTQERILKLAKLSNVEIEDWRYSQTPRN